MTGSADCATLPSHAAQLLHEVTSHSSTVHHSLTSLSSGVFSNSPMPSCCITCRTNSCTSCLRSVTPLFASSVLACTAAHSSFAVCQQNYTTEHDEYNT
jgi:hypothetical protein